MSVTITLTGARGGQGTSTTAAALALLAARRGHRVELITDDLDTMTALLGLPAPSDDCERLEIVDGLTLAIEPVRCCDPGDR